MARLDEITSTEKLLDLIRKKPDAQPQAERTPANSVAPPVFPTQPPPSSLLSQVKRRANKKHSIRRPVTVGVDVGHEYLRMVKTIRNISATPELLDQKIILIPSDIQPRSLRASEFLKKELNLFCGTEKKVEIWALMSAANVEVHHTRVPKVPKKQLEKVILWSIRKETPFDENTHLVDFKVIGEAGASPVVKLEVMYYTAPKQEIEEAKKLFARAGFPLTGLSIAPFAVQNIFRTHWLSDPEETVASLFIGNDFSRIDIYAHGNLVMTRGIKAGISSMVESLVEYLQEKRAAAGAADIKRTLDNREVRKIVLSLSPESPILTEEERLDLQEGQIWDAVLPALERLIRQVERTFEYFTTNLGNEKVGKIYVSGTMNFYKSLLDFTGAQLGMQSETLDPLSRQVDCRYYEGNDDNTCISERIAVTPALGMALSDNTYTPNFIYTFKDKEHEASVKRVNMNIFVVFIVSVLLCSGFYFHQLRAMYQKSNALAELEQEFAQHKPPVNRDVVMKTAAAKGKDMVSLKAYGKRYLDLAIISDLAKLTTTEIRLLNVKADLGGQSEKAAATTAGGKQAALTAAAREVQLEGFVAGDMASLETTLANYVMQLDNSPIFQEIKIKKSNLEMYRSKPLLRFEINMTLEGT